MDEVKSKENFKQLLFTTYKKPKGKYKFIDASGQNIIASFVTDYETDNGLELEDPNYEEFYGIAFKNEETGSCFEVNYHNLPIAAFCDHKPIY